MGPLDGIRVLDASTILAGPLACQILGDYGAEVLKIEHPGLGDGLRGHGPAKDGVPLWWSEVARNKRCLGLYLGDPRGADIFKRLVAGADVVVENFRPGTLERWGLGWEELSTVNPDLILARITGWGQDGPYAQRPGFGTLAEAMSGFADLTGDPEGPPTLPPFGLADTICGITAAGLVTMALYHRDARGGKGQVIDLSIIESMTLAAGPGPTIADQLSREPTRAGNRSTSNAPRNLYRTADGRWVAVSTSATSVARRVMELVGHPEVVDEEWFQSGAGRVEHGDMLDDWVAEWIEARNADDVTERFVEAGAAIAPVYSAFDVLEDEHFNTTGIISSVEDDTLGPIRMHGVLGRMSRTPGSVRHTGRPLGADSAAILAELGIAETELDELRGDGVVA